MPSGYTHIIGNGASFEQFVWYCTRAFGVCTTMRDDNMDKKIPYEFEPDTFYKSQVIDCKKELIKFSSLTRNEIKNIIISETKQVKQYNIQSKKEKLDLSKKYNDMLVKVKEWNPPTRDHEGLKKFMIEQIQESIKFDCGDYKQNLPEQNIDKFTKDRIENINKKITYYEEKYSEELVRCKERNKWLNDLRNSVPQPESVI